MCHIQVDVLCLQPDVPDVQFEMKEANVTTIRNIVQPHQTVFLFPERLTLDLFLLQHQILRAQAALM